MSSGQYSDCYDYLGYHAPELTGIHRTMMIWPTPLTNRMFKRLISYHYFATKQYKS